jgi:hypothetical protein
MATDSRFSFCSSCGDFDPSSDEEDQICVKVDNVHPVISSIPHPRSVVRDVGTFVDLFHYYHSYRLRNLNVVFRLIPRGPVVVNKTCSVTQWRKLSVSERPSYVSSVDGHFTIEGFYGAALLSKVGPPCYDVDSCERIVVVDNCTADSLRYAFTGRDITLAASDPILSYIMAKFCASLQTSIAPVSYSLQSTVPAVARHGFMACRFPSQRLTFTNGAVIVSHGVVLDADEDDKWYFAAYGALASAIGCVAAVTTLRLVRRFISGKVTRSRPVDLVNMFAPSVVKWFARHDLDVVDVALFFFDCICYWKGEGSRVTMTIRAGQVFNNSVMLVSIFIDAMSRFLEDWFGKPDVRLDAAEEFLRETSSAFSFKSAEGSARMFHNFVMASKDVECLVDRVMQWLPVWLRQSIAAFAPESAWYVLVSDLDPERLFKDADTLLTLENANLMAINGHNWTSLMDLKERFDVLTDRLIKSYVPPTFWHKVNDHKKKIKSIEDARETLDSGKHMRKTPFVVCFFGESGVHKSSTAIKIAQHIAPDGKIYPRNGALKSWDGYSPLHRIVVIDDAFMSNRYDECPEFLQLVSPMPMILPMASLDNSAVGVKGTYFQSEMIILTTNNAYPNVCDLVKPEALLRRRHLLIEFGPIDVDVLPELRRRYRVLNSVNPMAEKGNWMTFSEMYVEILRAKERHESNETIGPELINDLLDHASNIKLDADVPILHPFKFTERPVFSESFEGQPSLWQRIVGGVSSAQLYVQRVIKEFEMFLSRHLLLQWAAMLALCLPIGYLLWRRWRPQVSSDAHLYDRTPGRRVVKKRVVLDGKGEIDKLLQCQCNVTVTGAMGRSFSMQCIYMEQMLIFPGHLKHLVGPSDVYDVRFLRYAFDGTPCEYSFVIPDSSFVIQTENGKILDCACMYLPRHVPRGPRLTQFFPDEVRTSRCPAQLVLRAGSHCIRLLQLQVERSVEILRYPSGNQEIESGDRWIYPIVGDSGDCGGMLIGHFAGQDMVIGMHVGRNYDDRYGFAFPLDRSFIKACLAKQEVSFDEDVVLDGGEDVPELMASGEFFFLGNGMKNFIPRKTKIRRSVLYECAGPASTQPSVLVSSDPRISPDLRPVSPLYKACAKYSSPGKGFDPILLEQATGWAMEQFCVRTSIVPEVVSLKTAINGDPQRGYKSIDWNTSSGYRWKQFGAKEHLFDLDGGFRMPKKDLLEVITERIGKAAKGLRLASSLWLDNPKDERRSLEKIVAAKTRVFTIGELDFTLACRRFFMAFCEQYQKLHQTGPSAVGIVVESMDFDILARRLSRFSNFCDFDISNNDGEFPAALMFAVADVMDCFYAQCSWEDGCEFTSDPHEMIILAKLIRRVFVDEMVYRIQLAGNFRYMVSGGVGSGGILTTVFNTIGNSIMTAYCFFKLTPSDYHLSEHVEMAIFGDDQIMSVSKAAAVFFTPSQIEMVYLSVGRHITGADKHGLGEFKARLEDCTFLKCKFMNGLIFPGAWTPQLPLEVIRDTAYYIRDDDDPFEACLNNANSSLEFAYWHGRPVFDHLRSIYSRNLCLFTNKVLRTWETCDAQAMGAYYGVRKNIVLDANPVSRMVDNRWYGAGVDPMPDLPRRVKTLLGRPKPRVILDSRVQDGNAVTMLLACLCKLLLSLLIFVSLVFLCYVLYGYVEAFSGFVDSIPAKFSVFVDDVDRRISIVHNSSVLVRQSVKTFDWRSELRALFQSGTPPQPCPNYGDYVKMLLHMKRCRADARECTIWGVRPAQQLDRIYRLAKDCEDVPCWMAAYPCSMPGVPITTTAVQNVLGIGSRASGFAIHMSSLIIAIMLYLIVKVVNLSFL